MEKAKNSSSSQNKFPFLKAAPNGVIISVRLQPRSSRNQVEGISEGALKIRLTAPPVDGSANRALIEFLSDLTGIRKSAFSISKGHKSRDKSVLAEGVTLASLEEAFSRT